MAIQQSFELAGITVEGGYLRIIQLSGNQNQLTFVLAYQSGKNHDAVLHKSFSFVPDLDGENFIKQAYKRLKTLPGFEDAIDC